MLLLCSFPYSGHLLVGEAPGHKGCAMCGIPLTSQRILNESQHQFIKLLKTSLTVNGNQTERTATIVWEQLEGKKDVPAFWNIFPLHPHEPGLLNINRTPNIMEVSLGLSYLDEVINILQPHTVVAIGEIAASTIENRYNGSRFVKISHPSKRGYAGFISGFAKLGLQ